MSTLSVFVQEEGVGQIAAGGRSIQILLELDFKPDAEVVFEGLETDCRSLERRAGVEEHYVIDGRAFWGELVTLAPCQSTCNAFSLVRDRPTLRGVFKVRPDVEFQFAGAE